MKCKCCGKNLPYKFFRRNGKVYKTCGRCREIQRKRYKNNREYREYKKNYRKRYYQNNRDKQRDYSKRYNKRTGYPHASKRREKAKQLPNDLTNTEWHLTVEFFDSRCIYCNDKLQNPEQEHFIPLSKGGGYTLGNILPACRDCNGDKASDMPWIYMKKIGMNYREFHKKIIHLVAYVQANIPEDDESLLAHR